MNDRFTITIHDLNGVKQYNLHTIIKRIAFYVAIAVILLLLIGTLLIIVLDNTLEDIAGKKEILEQHNIQLKESIAATESDLSAKQQELMIVNDRLQDIETLIGLAPEEEHSLVDRADIVKMTSAQRAALLRHVPNGSPVEYRGITSKFGYRTHPTLQRREFHRGSDLKAPMNTEIFATANGVVEYADVHKASGYGRLIILDHNYGFRTFYGHLNKISVKSGQFVKKGELIGHTGNSGMSNGPHLHYEVRFIQRALNPFWFIKWSIENYSQIFEKETQVPWQSLITAITRDHQLERQAATQPSSQKVLLSRAR
jgi:murein DD-endopeptidase MepM/ murein hydrolase activator NlpD